MAKRGGFPGGMPGNMNNLMKQAQRMQRQMEEAQQKMEETEVEASAGGGAVTVKVSGKKEVISVKLQEEVEYPAIDEHKAKHEEFRKAVGELYEMLQEEEGPTPRFVEAVRKNVVNWLVNHIKSFDVSVASYINMKLEPDRI